ncbi:MAG TPA: P-loop NTPase [Bacillota bacterium]|nr:P-loop NTPase [Bacillota bacterium]
MDPRESIINRRFDNIKRIIALSGGKGGIGKSLTAATVALILAGRGCLTGLLDLDFCGPSAHVILGGAGNFPEEDKGILPPEIRRNLKLMSIAYFTGGNPSPFRGNDVSNAIVEILAITRWESLDFLILDMPPGIGDPALDILRLIKRVEFLLVTIPSLVAVEVTKKELRVLNELGIPVLGILENMKRNDGAMIEEEAVRNRVPFLGAVDFDPDVEDALGKPDQLLNTRYAKQLGEIINNMKGFEACR